jgi:class 3 adenylate cyclase
VEERRERKVVTVLFADLVGFTSRAEQSDPEDVEAELSRYHAFVRAELERYGGTVEKFIGDAAMAIFGAPVAHEDDPERAVRSALAIRTWAHSAGTELRIGINTGEALVRLGARPEAGEGMAAGDVVNTAARLQAAAPTNGILVGRATYRATWRAIDYREVEPVQAKGKAQPVPAWQAVQARARLPVERLHGSPLVGRAGELGLLTGALDRARRERSAQLVTLVGVPGIGKSRLVYELFRIVEAEPEPITWRQGRCLPYGDGVTFWALGEIVKAQAGIEESDGREDVERKLREVAHDARVESHLRPVVGLGAAEVAGTDRAEAFAAWRQFFEALAEVQPLVLVVEDLHWADDQLLDFIDHIVDWASGVPILVVCTARPEVLEHRPSWGGGKPNALTISLSPLSDDDTARLIGELVQEPADASRAELLARAGGNPLYAEEYARILLERGELAELPETVQGIVAARLDLLDPELKIVLQDAAVLGKTFWAGGLAAVSGLDRSTIEEQLHALERRDFIRRERRTAMQDETQYVFLHVLVRDVAYRQIPRAERADKHRRAAEWIGSLARPEDLAEMLASHYLQALELAEAAGRDTSALVEPARRAVRDAGDRAAALYAVDAALRFYDAALQLWPTDDPERAELLYRRAVPVGRHFGGGDPKRLAEARDAMLSIGDSDRAAEVEMLMEQSFRDEGKRELADEHLVRAEALLGDGPPTRARAWVLARLALDAYLRGEEQRAIELASETRDMSEKLGWEEGMSDALRLLGLVRVTAGDARGVDDLERSVEFAAASGALGVQAYALNMLAVANQMLGDLERGYGLRLEGERCAERLGSESLTRFFRAVLTDHRYRRGDWEEARRGADDLLARVDAEYPYYLAWQVFALRAELRLAKGDPAGAIADADQALTAARASPDVQAMSFTLLACAHVFAIASDRERATALAHELLDFLRSGARLQFAVINLPAFACATVLLGLGDQLVEELASYPESPWTEAVRAYVAGDFVTAAEILAQAGARPDEAEARLRAAERLAAGGRFEERDTQIEQALSFYRSVGATTYIHEAEGLLAAGA